MMNRKGITRKQSKAFLITAIVLFIAAEVIAEALDIWLVNHPSVECLHTYNRWLSNVPSAISTGASVLLACGVLYYSRRNLIFAAITGVVMVALSFALTSMNVFSTTIEYYPGFYFTIVPGPIANLFDIGIGAIIAPIISFLLRDTLRIKTNVEA